MLPSWYIEILEKKCWCYQCFVDQIRGLEAVFDSVVHWKCLSTRSLATIIRLYLSWRKRRAIKSKKPKALLMVIIPMHWHLICSKLDGSWSSRLKFSARSNLCIYAIGKISKHIYQVALQCQRAGCHGILTYSPPAAFFSLPSLLT
jgi:hypothetical protein